ncbi:MAG: hypothetical protein EOO17_02850 [Chloroflexi bacterium]|nr:MAG: hypothetical protein EOO17_02850 [Chloroflexota bacterium]
MKHKHLWVTTGNAGYTIVELVVAMALTTILSIALIGFMVTSLGQSAIAQTRSQLTNTIQTTLGRINDDVRRSYGVMSNNSTPDPSAPSASGEWASSASTLVIAQPALKADGGTYDSAARAYDTIVYYRKDSNIYKRTIAYPDSENAITTLTCPATASGGCPSDILIANNTAGLSFTYYTKTGTTTMDPILAGSVKTTLSFERTQSGQQINMTDDSMMTPRIILKFSNNAQMTSGFGGLDFAGNTRVNGGPGTNLFSAGGLTLGQGDIIGTTSAPIGKIDILNNGCGTNASYGTSCSPSEPIALNGSGPSGSEIRASRVCARDQVSSTYTGSFGARIYGLEVPCTPKINNQPLFDKAGHAARMTSVVPGRTCQSSCASMELPALTKFTGNVLATGAKTVNLRGDLYITGDFVLGDSAPGTTILTVDPTLTKRPIVVVNGRINFTNMRVETTTSITPIFVSFYSLDSAKSADDAYITQDPKTIYDAANPFFNVQTAISLSGTGSVYDGSYYAYFGRILTGISVTVNGTVAAQKLSFGYGTIVNLKPYVWFDQ